jgi:hypothetical protein
MCGWRLTMHTMIAADHSHGVQSRVRHWQLVYGGGKERDGRDEPDPKLPRPACCKTTKQVNDMVWSTSARHARLELSSATRSKSAKACVFDNKCG